MDRVRTPSPHPLVNPGAGPLMPGRSRPLGTGPLARLQSAPLLPAFRCSNEFSDLRGAPVHASSMHFPPTAG